MGIPTAQDIRNFLEGYCTEHSVISDDWLTKRRDQMVIPFIERTIRLSLRETSEITEYHSGVGNSTLILNRRPVIEITNITYVSIPNQQQTGNLLASIELIADEGIIRSKVNFNEASFEPIFPRGTNNIKITYTYGFTDLVDSNDVEATDIHEAILNMVSKQALVFIGARTGGGSLSQTNWSRNYGDRGRYTDVINLMDQNAYAILRKYSTSVVGA